MKAEYNEKKRPDSEAQRNEIQKNEIQKNEIQKNEIQRSDDEDRITWKFFIPYVLAAIAVSLLIRFVIPMISIPSESMEPTLPVGSIYIDTRWDTDDIDRYDIVVFNTPEKDKDDLYIKRVIGLPGETITVTNGKVYAGRTLLDDSFIAEEMNTRGDGVYVVPEGCYFMMGDNRNNSCDSRFWTTEDYRFQYVPQDQIRSVTHLRVWPLTGIGFVDYEEPEDMELTEAADEDWGGDHVHDWKETYHTENYTGKGTAGFGRVSDGFYCTYCGAEKPGQE